MNTMTVGAPRVVSELTGRSSSDSNEKSTRGLGEAVDAPGNGAIRAAWVEPPHDTAAASAAAHAARMNRAGGADAALLVGLLSHELVFTVGEENVEGRQ